MKTSKLIFSKLFIIILLGFNGCALPVVFGGHDAVLASEMGVTYEYDATEDRWFVVSTAATDSVVEGISNNRSQIDVHSHQAQR